MKRIWIVSVLLLAIVASGTVSLIHLNMVTMRMLDSLENIAETVDRDTGGSGEAPSPEGGGDPAQSGVLEKTFDPVQGSEQSELMRLAHDFQKQWEEGESVMMHYIHHDELDAITGTVARLQALARYNAVPEFAAEIDRLRHLIRHIYESQLPYPINLF